MSIIKDLGIKIALDTVLAKNSQKSLVLKYDELIQKAAVSGFYVYFVEDTVAIAFNGAEEINFAVPFLIEIVGKTVAEILAKILWNTMIDALTKTDNKLIGGKIMSKKDVEYIPIIISNIVSASFGAGWKMLKSKLEKAPSTSPIDTVLQSV